MLTASLSTARGRAVIIVRLRYSSLRWHATGRIAIEDYLGRNPETLRQHRGRQRAPACIFELRERLCDVAGSYHCVEPSCTEAQPTLERALDQIVEVETTSLAESLCLTRVSNRER